MSKIFKSVQFIFIFLWAVHIFPNTSIGQLLKFERQAPVSFISSIFADEDGGVWVAAGGGEKLHKFDRTRWKKYDAGGHVFARGNDEIFTIIDNKLHSWKDGVLSKSSDVNIGVPVTGVYCDGKLFIASAGSIHGGIYTYDGADVEKIYSGSCISVDVDHSGVVWMTTSTIPAKLFSFQNTVWTEHSNPELLNWHPVLADNRPVVVSAPDSSVWVMNRGKYSIFRDGVWTGVYETSAGVNPIWLSFDKSGGVWSYQRTTQEGILYKMDSQGKWNISASRPSGIASTPNFFATPPDNSIWTADSNNIYKLDGNNWIVQTSSFDLASDTVICMVYYDDKLYCGHGGKNGLSVLAGGELTNHIPQFGLYPHNKIRSFYKFVQSIYGYGIAAYAEEGFFFLENGNWIPFENLTGYMITNNLQMIDMCYTDRLWVISDQGLLEAHEDTTIHHKPETGKHFPAGEMTRVIPSIDGYVYVIHNMRISKYDGLAWSEVLSDSPFLDFAIADDGKFWGNSDAYLLSWDPVLKELEEVEPMSNGTFLGIDPLGRIWAKSQETTGFYEGNKWTHIEKLQNIISDRFAFSQDGKIAMNSTNEYQTEYYGLYEYFHDYTSVEEEKPASFYISGNYPNPFNPFTMIYFELPSQSKVRINIYNSRGQLVDTLADAFYPAGRSTVNWNPLNSGSTVSSGLYFYRIESDFGRLTGKMLFLK